VATHPLFVLLIPLRACSEPVLFPFQIPQPEVLHLTTGDITKRLEAEQQLIQASKMATLGEMASGVAHELNQPLSVIKTAGSILIKKLRKSLLAEDETL
jgi:histidine kinase